MMVCICIRENRHCIIYSFFSPHGIDKGLRVIKITSKEILMKRNPLLYRLTLLSSRYINNFFAVEKFSQIYQSFNKDASKKFSQSYQFFYEDCELSSA